MWGVNTVARRMRLKKSATVMSSVNIASLHARQWDIVVVRLINVKRLSVQRVVITARRQRIVELPIVNILTMPAWIILSGCLVVKFANQKLVVVCPIPCKVVLLATK